MFEPSRTITSLELNESSMLGGTVKYNKINWKNIERNWNEKQQQQKYWNKITQWKWGKKEKKKM